MFSSLYRDCISPRLPVLLAAFFLPSALIADFASTQCFEKGGELKFEYRLEPEAEVESITATQNGQSLECQHTPFANNPLRPGAILVMVDTSAGSVRAPRDRTLACNKAFIESLASQSQPQNLIGVYGFANDLVEILPLSRPSANIRSKLTPLKADGPGTRIYRQGMRAIELLAATPAARKTLVILSDGKDEDNGFSREDLVKSALTYGISISAMGCPETGIDIPALGNLEKLSFETRGLYAQAKIGEGEPGERLQADAAFARSILALVNSGGEATIPLNQLADSGDILFTIQTKGNETLTYLWKREAPAPPANLPVPPLPSPQAAAPSSGESSVAAKPTVAAKPAEAVTTPGVQPAPRTPVIQKNNTIAQLISTGSIVLLGVAILILRRRSRSSQKAAAAPPSAYLLMQDAESTRIPLTGIATRIGRRPDNDIVFSNTSVSGYHAEIHIQRDGSHLITDLGSGNGLSVNAKPVSQSPLHDGDLVEIGEVRFRFHLSSN